MILKEEVLWVFLKDSSFLSVIMKWSYGPDSALKNWVQILQF